MSKMPKVSVVVPVYGVERYIERCARSLFEQTLEDMEFVFVDDCTKDNSIAILEKVISDYPNRKKQIKIVHHEYNKGLSYARETGVKNAAGDYIGHCDSDDWVDKSMYEELYYKASEQSLDFLRCNYRITNGDTILREVSTYKDGGVLNKNTIISWLVADQGWNSIWCTLVKREVYYNNHIEFTNNSMLEDMFVVLQLLTYSTKIDVLEKSLYNYFYNNNSITKVRSVSAILDRARSAYENIEWMISFIRKHYDINYFKDEMIVLSSHPRRIMIPALKDHHNYKLWNNYYKELGLKPIFSKYFTRKAKIQYAIAYFRIYPLYSVIKK